jgi:vitamin B12/bleomycin/antimicrobial peptide transport system ATP-binding/permease protein
VVIGDANTEIAKGERVLIVGVGQRKEHALPGDRRAVAVGPGRSRCRMRFLPQRPYLPLGTLRAVLCYPASVRKFPIAAVKAALKRCGLEQLIRRLNEQERWDRVLSGGEQQRLAFCRLILHKPDWVFMDEKTSPLDEESQKSMMNLFTKELAGATLISIAHRAGLDAFHDRTLALVDSVGGARLVTKRRPRFAGKPPARRKRRPLKALVLHRLRSSGAA